MKSSAKRSPTASRSRSRRRQLLISCEHGGNRVPARYAPLFAGAAGVLDSHRGLDYGALEVARAFGRRLGVAPFAATTTRLVVDLNRSPYHRNVFSEYTRALDREERALAMAAHYWPYRNAVEGAVDYAVAMGLPVLHVSSHSFTPVLHGDVRNCDIGFLYDPARSAEARFIDAWHAAVCSAAPQLVLRRNYPYRGTSDALVTHLRRRHRERVYAGVEIEVNQKYVGSRSWRSLVSILTTTLATAARF
ncbi:MAG: N-formylglutamate amidohydrolase [Gammaproteobacteria bacterium]